MNIQLESSWLTVLEEEFHKDYIQEIKKFLTQEIKA